MKIPLPQFYQKNGLVVIRMAREIYNMDVGDRLPSIAQYAEEIPSGRGTIQTAINFLLENRCITLEKQGPKGTFLASIDRGRLWEFTDWKILFGACPFPSGDVFPSLTSAIHYSLQEGKIPFALSFVIATHNRLLFLEQDRYSFVVASRLAMQAAQGKYKNLEIAIELTGCKYSVPYALLHRDDHFEGIKEGARLAVHVSSLEQSLVADLLCKERKMQQVKLTSQETLAAFANREVDYILIRPDIYYRPTHEYHICTLEHLGLDEASTTPVILTNSSNYGMAQLLRRHMDVSKIRHIQSMVRDKEMEVYYY